MKHLLILIILVVILAGCTEQYAVTAYDPNGNECWSGNEITIFTPDGFRFEVCK